jgi:hypothetical protein
MLHQTFGLWQSNVFTMSKKASYPDDLGGLRNKIADMVKDIGEIKARLQRPSIWSWADWEGHQAKLFVFISVLTVALGAVWYVFGLILDSHVRSGVALSDGPMQSDIRRIDGAARITAPRFTESDFCPEVFDRTA